MMFCQIKLDVVLPSVTDFCLQASSCMEVQIMKFGQSCEISGGI